MAIAPAAATMIHSPPMAVLYGLNFGSVWGLKVMAGPAAAAAAAAALAAANPPVENAPLQLQG